MEQPKSEYDLSIGNAHLWDALEARYPTLSPFERQVLGNNVIIKVSESLRAGEILASLRPDPSGNLELAAWDIGPLGPDEGRKWK